MILFNLVGQYAMVQAQSKIAYAFPELRCSFGSRSIILDITIY